MNKIQEALLDRFKLHRVIFWYDEKAELEEKFDEIELEGVSKIQVEANEFELKYIINKQKPESKFLLYFKGPKPSDEDNWLLDMELAHCLFYTDQESLFLQEIGLGYQFKELVAEHLEFFRSKERRVKLKEILAREDERNEIRMKMLSIVFNTEFINVITYIQAHGSALVRGDGQLEKDLERFNLKRYYWGIIQNQFNYINQAPSIYDLLLEVFTANFSLSKNLTLNRESRLILSLWQDSLQYRESFAILSEKVAGDLKIEEQVQKISLEEIIEDDLFKIVDQKIVHELVNLVVNEEISYDRLVYFIKKRENKFWYEYSGKFYEAIRQGALLTSLVRQYQNCQFSQFNEGIDQYTSAFYEIDLAYRKFIVLYRQSGQNKILSNLAEKIEKIYSNDWLLQLNNEWQIIINQLESWPVLEKSSQQLFFNLHAKPYLEKGNRLFIIITDALRFECGVELAGKLKSENRYESSLGHMIASIPSYTQLGMASLLPHKKIELQEGTDTILVDGISSAGIQGRMKVLSQNAGNRATAIKAEDFMKMNASIEGRDFVKQYDLIYIYHNRIDKTGDDKDSEEKVFEAVDTEIDFLLNLIKKIANMNGTNMIVTTDHGFIYQNQPLAESDFSISRHTGEVWKENRRFIIGKNLSYDDSTLLFKAKSLNIETDADVLIPKSINRLRVKGAGSRYIHGGTSLQEIVIPLIKVTKKRKNTTSQVEIDIIKSTDKITTNILAVSFIQQELVTEQVLSRTIRAAIYSEDGELLSDQFKYIFDIEDGSERQREVKHRFQLLSKASGQYKGQRVKLMLEEPVEGTSKWKEYKHYLYTLNISFTSDFDD